MRDETDIPKLGAPSAVRRPCAAFSLIEIVLAVGIVSVALLAIFGMFSVSLSSSAETLSRHEVQGVTRAFGDFLQSTNPSYGAGFSNVSNWLATGTDPGLFCYLTSNGYTNGVGANISDAAGRTGRLFRMVIALSSNVPGITGMADIASNAFLPLQVRVYAVPSTGAATTNLQPLLTYETSVTR